MGQELSRGLHTPANSHNTYWDIGMIIPNLEMQYLRLTEAGLISMDTAGKQLMLGMVVSKSVFYSF